VSDAFMHEGCPAIVDAGGTVRKLGAIPPSPLLASAFPLFEDAVPLLTDDQLRAFCAGKPKSGRHRFGDDWIKDQGQYGSCNGFASAAALERARVRRGLPRVRLSGASVYSCVNGGRDQGSIPEDAMRSMQDKGAVPEDRGPPSKIYPSQYSAADWAEGARFKSGECYTTRSRQALYTGLALGYDGVIAVHAGNNFMRLGTNGIAGGDSGPGNHAVLVDDLDVLADGLIVMDFANSWNLSYGQRGRAYLTFERHCAQPAGYFAFYLIRSTADDPQGDNPPIVG